jgi:hypothetical protein
MRVVRPCCSWRRSVSGSAGGGEEADIESVLDASEDEDEYECEEEEEAAGADRSIRLTRVRSSSGLMESPTMKTKT